MAMVLAVAAAVPSMHGSADDDDHVTPAADPVRVVPIDLLQHRIVTMVRLTYPCPSLDRRSLIALAGNTITQSYGTQAITVYSTNGLTIEGNTVVRTSGAPKPTWDFQGERGMGAFHRFWTCCSGTCSLSLQLSSARHDRSTDVDAPGLLEPIKPAM